MSEEPTTRDCPKCGQPMKQGDNADVWRCETCGYTQTPEGETEGNPLFSRAVLGDPEELLEYLENATEAEKAAFDETHISPVYIAARENLTNSVRVLLRHGFSGMSRDPTDKGTALHWACARGSDSLIHELCANNADATAADSDGWQPLHLACAAGMPFHAIDTLAQFGADVETQDVFGMRPLHWACLFGRLDSAAAMMALGVDIHAENHFGHTPKKLAEVADSGDIIREIDERLRAGKALQTQRGS